MKYIKRSAMKLIKALLITLVITSTTQAETLTTLVLKPMRAALAAVHGQLENAQAVASIYANTEAMIAGYTLRKAQHNANLSAEEIIHAKRLIEEVTRMIVEIETAESSNIPASYILTIIKNLQELFLITRHFNFAGLSWMPRNS